MFFRKAKRIKFLEEYVEYYAKRERSTRYKFREDVRKLAEQNLREHKELREKEKMLIAGMLNFDIKKLEFNWFDLAKADYYELKHTCNPMFDKDWLEINAIKGGKE